MRDIAVTKVVHYGDAAMFQAEALLSTKHQPTLNVEMCPLLKTPNTGYKKALFERKILLQLNTKELIQFASLMQAQIGELSIKRHSKGMTFVRQTANPRYPGGIHIRATAGKGVCFNVLLPIDKLLSLDVVARQQVALAMHIPLEQVSTALQSLQGLH